jgi:hypothetical protein
MTTTPSTSQTAPDSLVLGPQDRVVEGHILLEGVPEIEVILASLHQGLPLESKHYKTDGFHLWWDVYLRSTWVPSISPGPAGWSDGGENVVDEIDHPCETKSHLIGYRCHQCERLEFVNTWACPFYDFRGAETPRGTTLTGQAIYVIGPSSTPSDRLIKEAAFEHYLGCPQPTIGIDHRKEWEEIRRGRFRGVSGIRPGVHVPGIRNGAAPSGKEG